MADQNVVRTIQIRGSSTGLRELTADLSAVDRAQTSVSQSADGVAVSTDRSAKRVLSCAGAYDRLLKSLDDNYRSSQQLAKGQATVDRAFQQGTIQAQEYARAMQLLQDRYGQASGAQKAFGTASQALNLQIASLASGLGITGQVLSAFGPWGFGAAVALGAVQSALSLASDKSHELAAKAKDIHEFAEATGLTTSQFQALRSEAGKFGIDSDTLATGLSKFTAAFQDIRDGSSPLIGTFNKIDSALVKQMQSTQNTADAFMLFGKAIANTQDTFKRNDVLKQMMGRGSATFGAFLSSKPDVAALGDAFEAAGRGIDKNLIEKLRQLQIDIDKTKSAANTAFAGLFGTSTLEAELDFQRGLLSISKSLQQMKLSDDFQKLIDFFLNPAVQGLLAGAVGGAGIGLLFGGLGALPGTILGGGAGFLAGAGKSVVQQRGRDAAATAAVLPGSSRDFDVTFSAFPDTRENLKLLSNEAQKLMSVLGSAATPTERLNASIAQLNLRAKEAGVSMTGTASQTAVYDRAVASLKLDSAIERQNVYNSALGQSATVTDLVAARTLQLQKLQQQGAGLTSSQIAFQRQLTASQALGTFQIDAQTQAEQVRIAAMGMSNEAAIAYTIVQTKINEAHARGADLTQDEIAKLQQSADAFAKAKMEGDNFAATLQMLRQGVDSAGQFFDTLAQSMAKGTLNSKTLTDALGTLASSLQSIGNRGLMTQFENLLKGNSLDPTSLATSGAFALGGFVLNRFSAIFAQRQADEEAAQKAAQDALERVDSYHQRALSAADDTRGLANQLAQFDRQAIQQRIDEWKKGGAAIADLENALAAERLAIVQKSVADSQAAFDALIQEAESATQKAVAALSDATSNLATALTALGKGIDGLSGGVDQAIGRLQSDFAGGLIQKIDSAFGADYLDSIVGLAKQHRQDLIDAPSLGIDTGLVDQAFSAQVQKIIDGSKLAGDAFQQLTYLFPQLNGKVHEFSQTTADAATTIADAVKTAQDAVTTAQQTLTATQSALVNAYQSSLGAAESALAQSVTSLISAYTSEFNAAQQNVVTAYNAQTQALQSTIDKMNSYVASLKSFQDSLRFGSYSTLSMQEQLEAARSSFQSVSSKAASGDADALSQLQAVSQAFLEQSKSFNASNTAYAADYNAVQSALTAAQDAATKQVSQSQQQMDLAKQQVTALGIIIDNTRTLDETIGSFRSVIQLGTTLQQQYGLAIDTSVRSGADAITAAINRVDVALAAYAGVVAYGNQIMAQTGVNVFAGLSLGSAAIVAAVNAVGASQLETIAAVQNLTNANNGTGAVALAVNAVKGAQDGLASAQAALVADQATQTQYNLAATEIATNQLAQLVMLNKNVLTLAATVAAPAATTPAAIGVNAAAAAAAEAAKTWHYPSTNPYPQLAAGGLKTADIEWARGDINDAAHVRFRAEHPEARYLMGGLVSGGLYNQDSVHALLAGGEYVIPAPQVTPQTVPILQDIRAGRTPQTNENGSREIGIAINRQTDMLISENRQLRDEVANMRDEIVTLNRKLALVLAAA